APGEPDPEVRAAMVRTLALLGRTREDVRTALIAELQSRFSVVSAEAAGGLELLANQPSIVAPLLDYLARVDGEENSVNVLTAGAQNRPAGVFSRLLPLLSPPHPPRVRGPAVRALMACETVGLALDTLSQLWVKDDTHEVHFAMAASLGDRVRQLAPEAP